VYGHPKHVLDEAQARQALAAFDRAALLVTHGATGFMATHLPLVVQGDRLIGHVARANPHWREAPCDALVVLAGAETYISPSWYETKAQTGRAVPTWNYETIHVHGRLTTYEDAASLRENVRALSDRHEAAMPAPWSIDDAPGDYIAALLNAIVGVEIAIERVEAKRKLSQEKPPGDHAGALAALDASPDPRDRAVAAAMRAAIAPRSD
jgi:transcriptional regulator